MALLAFGHLCHGTSTVVAWGANDSLQSVVPGDLTNVVALAAGESHSLALEANGTVRAWGFNLYGQTTVPTNLTGVVALAAGSSYSMALQANGTVVVWGGQPPAPPDLTNAVAIAGGWSHLLALQAEGTVVSWGSLTNVPDDLTNVVSISAGSGYSLALKADGTVVAWGDDSYGQLELPPNLTNITAIAAGAGHCLALQRSGAVIAWGRNDFGQATVPPSSTTALAISAGALHSIALKPDGTVLVWGNDSYGQVSTAPSDTNFISIVAGGYHNLALKGTGAPSIFLQPANATGIVSKNVSFQVGALGAQQLRYQWQFSGTNLAGATRSTLTRRNLQLTDAGPYTVVVTNAFGAVTSAPALLTVVGVPPYVTVPPQDSSTICGDGATFQVQVDGSAPFSYQWEFAGAAIDGATNTALTLTNVDLSGAGLYSVTITNAFGLVTTGAVLTVTVAPPSITSPLKVTGTQGTPFTYQITGLHTPESYSAMFLPYGLTLDSTNGLITGVPLESGMYPVVLTVANACTNDTELMSLTINSGLPVIT
ncbi:MAG: immunoglobulin domain-containing protein, partial [Limisphaerales bacterium]